MNLVVVILNLLAISGVLYWIWYKDKSIIRKFYWLAAIIKLVAGLAVGFIHYEYYAQSDTAGFYTLALELRELALHDFTAYLKTLASEPEGYFLGKHRTIFFIKAQSVVALLTGGNYYVSSLIFSLLSFLAAWNLARWITRLDAGLAMPGVVAFLLFPSCVFWTSGVLKESLAMAGLFYLASLSIKILLRHRLSVVNVLLVVPAVWILWSLKYYYAAVFIPVTAALLITHRMAEKFLQSSFWGSTAVFFGIILVLLAGAERLHPNLKFEKVPAVIYQTHQASLLKSDQVNVVHYANLNPSWKSMLLHAPQALVSGLFTPVIPRFSNSFQVLAVFENLVLLVLTLFAFPALKQLLGSYHRLEILAILTYVVLLAVFIALSTPNVGTLVRYRVGYLPFFILLILQQPFLRQFFDRFLPK